MIPQGVREPVADPRQASNDPTIADHRLKFEVNAETARRTRPSGLHLAMTSTMIARATGSDRSEAGDLTLSPLSSTRDQRHQIGHEPASAWITLRYHVVGAACADSFRAAGGGNQGQSDSQVSSHCSKIHSRGSRHGSGTPDFDDDSIATCHRAFWGETDQVWL